MWVFQTNSSADIFCQNWAKKQSNKLLDFFLELCFGWCFSILLLWFEDIYLSYHLRKGYERDFSFFLQVSVTLTSSYDSYADVDTRDGNLSIASFFQVGFCKVHESLCSPCALLEYLCLKQFDSRRAQGERRSKFEPYAARKGLTP